jgi:DTW domain-containing protein YfiP
LQHPNERKRAIRTAKMLEKGLKNCLVFVRRKIVSIEHFESLSQEEKLLRSWLRSPNVYVLFPTEEALTPQNLISDQHSARWVESRAKNSKKSYFKNVPKIIFQKYLKKNIPKIFQKKIFKKYSKKIFPKIIFYKYSNKIQNVPKK